MLYQMATGQRPFGGDTSVSIISSIIKDTPVSITELNQTLPRHLGRIVKRCLSKDPARRYQAALDLRNDLEELREEVDSGEVSPAGIAPSAGPRRRGLLVALAAIAVVIVVLGYVWVNHRPGSSERGTAQLSPTFVQLTSQPGPELFPSLSPDGKTVIYVHGPLGNWDIYALRVGGQNPVNLTKDCPKDDKQPAFSPDGNWIVFRSEREDGGIFVMGATGESPRRLTDFGFHPQWSPDGDQVVFASIGFVMPRDRSGISELWVVDVATAEQRRISEGDAVQPHWSPNGHRIAYWAVLEGGRRDIHTIPASGGEPVPVTDDAAVDWSPVWSPDGRYLYFASDRGGSMNSWRVPIDDGTGKTLGEPQPVTTGASASTGSFSLSMDGQRLAYVSATTQSNVERVPFDPSTQTVEVQPVSVTRGSTRVGGCDPSPDSEWLVCLQFDRQEDIFLLRPDGTGRRQLTNDLSKDRFPRWSPDGKRIAFYSDRSGSYEIWTINRDGSGLHQLTATPGRHALFPLWSPDGKRILFQHIDSGETFAIEPDTPWAEQSAEALSLPDEDGETFRPWSWSSDGQRLLGTIVASDTMPAGIGMYTLETSELETLMDRGSYPMWLGENGEFVYSSGSELLLGRIGTSKILELLSVAPATINPYSVRPSRDGRTIYYARATIESDIWMLTLN
jgi:Tol biopolymer transport system component